MLRILNIFVALFIICTIFAFLKYFIGYIKNLLILNIAVLDPDHTKNTYSFQQAKIFQQNLEDYAKKLGKIIRINIISCKDHEAVINSLIDKNTIALQPISNSSTGLVPYKVFKEMVSKLSHIEFYGGIELKIENRLIAKTEHKILLNPENYKDIDIILTHLAPEGQCKKHIDLIRAANPKRELLVINTFNSTTDAVSALKSEEYADKKAVAIGNIESAIENKLEYTSTPWQDYPYDNFTTFLVVGDEYKVNLDLKGLLYNYTFQHSETGKFDFIASLPIGDNLGSLSEFLQKLKSFDVDLNYIKVDTQNGNVNPYFSGTVSNDKFDELSNFIDRQKAILNIGYNRINTKDREKIQNFTNFDGQNLRMIKDSEGNVGITANVPNYPGALADVLEQIKLQNINLTSLEVFARGCEAFAVLKASAFNK